jgi:hypothetical protein
MLINEVNQSKKTIPETISYLLDKIFGIRISSSELKKNFMDMKLSDLIDLDVAFTNKDEIKIRKILKLDLNEYSMPGRANIKSSAPETNKTQVKPSTTGMTSKPDNTTNTSNISTGGTLSADEMKLQKEIEAKEKEQEDLKSELEMIKKTAGIK